MKLKLLLLLLIAHSALATVPMKYDELPDSVKKGIAEYEFVVQEKEVEDAPWPRYTVITTIDIPAKDAISIFSAYHRQKNFVPGLISSTPVKHVSPTDVHVAFEMNSPWPVPNSRYTTGNKIVVMKDGRFQVQWYYVKSNLTSDNKGQITFIPMGEKKTLVHYQTFILPTSMFASLVKSKVRGDLVETIKSIKGHLVKVGNKGGEELSYYRSLFDRAVKGENVYSEMIKRASQEK